MKLYSKERRKKRSKYYKTGVWQKIRRLQLKKSAFCELCLKKTPKIIKEAKIVDHIDCGWETWNEFCSNKLQSLCFECHTQKTFGIDLPKLAKKQRTELKIQDI